MHFTYALRDGDLEQGDILRRTDALKELLRPIHPHYAAHKEYEYLIVLTQSCDLVRRGGACKSAYISLAAVRPLTTLLERRLSALRKSPTEQLGGLANETAHRLMLQLVERLLNNNEPGYFFFREEPTLGIDEPYVAFLTLSVALKSDQHYDRCVAARIAGLKEEFQAKVGWLVGNMYARPATKDWVPEACTEAEFAEFQNEYLDRLGVIWVPDRDIDKVRKRCKQLATERGVAVSPELAGEVVGQVASEKESKHSRVAARAAALLGDMGLVTDEKDRAHFERRLASDQEFKGLV